MDQMGRTMAWYYGVTSMLGRIALYKRRVKHSWRLLFLVTRATINSLHSRPLSFYCKPAALILREHSAHLFPGRHRLCSPLIQYCIFYPVCSTQGSLGHSCICPWNRHDQYGNMNITRLVLVILSAIPRVTWKFCGSITSVSQGFRGLCAAGEIRGYVVGLLPIMGWTLLLLRTLTSYILSRIRF